MASAMSDVEPRPPVEAPLPLEHPASLVATLQPTEQMTTIAVAQSPSDRLSKLSNELLTSVIEFLSSHDSDGFAQYGLRHLLKLARCSRRLYKITEPVLYTHYRDVPSRSTVHQFICRVLVRPDLANRVQICSAYPTSEALNISQIQKEDWERIRVVVHEASRSEGEASEWSLELEKGCWEAFTALLLLLLPRLQTLNLYGWDHVHSDNSYMARLLPRTLSRVAELQTRSEVSSLAMNNLRSLKISYQGTKLGLEVDDLVKLLKIPSIQVFDAFSVHHDDSPSQELLSALCHLEFSTKRLSLHYALIEHETFAQFLRCFKSLESLYFMSDIRCIIHEPLKILKILGHLKPCLQELTLIRTTADCISGDYKGYPMGSLADFKKLRILDVEASLLTGHDDTFEPLSEEGKKLPWQQSLKNSIPPTLESLTMRDCGVDECAAPAEIIKLIAEKDTYAPNLKRLDME